MLSERVVGELIGWEVAFAEEDYEFGLRIAGKVGGDFGDLVLGELGRAVDIEVILG